MAKVDYYGYMGFVDFMAEREKSQRSAIWCGFRGFFIGAAFCPSVFELSFLISICLCIPFGGCLSLNEVVGGDLEAYLFFAVFFFW